jgi:uncharacterized protein (DUF2252 family)
VEIVPADLTLKHRLMAETPFSFLRAAFYRWAQLWPLVCGDLSRAPKVLAVGDLHVENFGTWRNTEGRLVWGVNDFDEAWPAAYTADLVRLLTSAYLAISEQHLEIGRRDVQRAIESGYRDAVAFGARLLFSPRSTPGCAGSPPADPATRDGSGERSNAAGTTGAGCRNRSGNSFTVPCR